MPTRDHVIRTFILSLAFTALFQWVPWRPVFLRIIDHAWLCY